MAEPVYVEFPAVLLAFLRDMVRATGPFSMEVKGVERVLPSPLVGRAVFRFTFGRMLDIIAQVDTGTARAPEGPADGPEVIPLLVPAGDFESLRFLLDGYGEVNLIADSKGDPVFSFVFFSEEEGGRQDAAETARREEAVKLPRAHSDALSQLRMIAEGIRRGRLDVPDDATMEEAWAHLGREKEALESHTAMVESLAEVLAQLEAARMNRLAAGGDRHEGPPAESLLARPCETCGQPIGAHYPDCPPSKEGPPEDPRPPCPLCGEKLVTVGPPLAGRFVWRCFTAGCRARWSGSDRPPEEGPRR